jgi:CarboxypepD_reg-like domain
MLKWTCLAVVLLAATACSDNRTTTSPSPTQTPTTTFSLTGAVTGGNVFTGTTPTAILGATVSVIDGPNAGKSTTTDASGKYTFTGLQQSGFTVNVSAVDYVSQSRPVTLTSNQTLNFVLTQPPATIVLTGRVTDATTSAPIAGAVVSINGRYRATTDSAGNYTVTGLLDAGSNTDITYVSASGYAADYHYIRGATQNVRLYHIERITAGDSKVVTVAPDDTLCVNNVQDSPGLGPDSVCRSVRVLVTRDGVMTVEALSTQDGTRPPIEVEVNSNPVDWNPSLRNPTSSFSVTAGTEVVVNVEMLAGSPTSQSFVVNTSISPQ